MTDGYLSRDREYLAKQQRERRAGMVRVDYMPSREAVAILRARRAQEGTRGPQATNSAILDAIVTDWARMTGINYRQESKPKTSASRPEFLDRSARANNSGFCQSKRARVRANDSDSTARVICEARRRRDGLPCQALSVPGKRRCKWHGGCSTGPRTADGRARSLANLRQYANYSEAKNAGNLIKV